MVRVVQDLALIAEAAEREAVVHALLDFPNSQIDDVAVTAPAMLLIASRDQNLLMADTSHQSVASWRNAHSLAELQRYPRCAPSFDTSLRVEAFNERGVASVVVSVDASKSVDLVPDKATAEVILLL